MAFEVLAPHIDLIEKCLIEKKSPRAIAEELGDPGLWQSIRRYKKAVFDLNKEANIAWKEERAKTYEARIEAGKAEIVNTLEVINLGKLRAKQLLSLNLNDDYKTADDEQKKLSLGSAAIYWQAGQKMICELSRAELELSGDDGESKKADALLEWSETRSSILKAADNDPEAKEALIKILQERR